MQKLLELLQLFFSIVKRLSAAGKWLVENAQAIGFKKKKILYLWKIIFDEKFTDYYRKCLGKPRFIEG